MTLINILDEDYDLKGLELSGPRGTPAWMAPEMLENLKVSTATDIYGLGLILWEMKSGERPFVNLTLEEVCTAIKEGHKPTMPSDVTDDLRALMTACWCTDPRQRPNCEEVLSKLNQMSFPNNHWQALFGNSPLIDTPIGKYPLMKNRKKNLNFPKKKLIFFSISRYFLVQRLI